MTTVALAGRRVDPEDAQAPRFPIEYAGEVERRITEYLCGHDVRHLVCSAACGADLLALSAAASLDIPSTVVLPYDAELFRRTSVTDRPGDWEALYYRSVERARQAGRLIVLDSKPGNEEAYQAATLRIIEEAAQHAPDIRACIVWEGQAQATLDHSNALARAAKERGWAVDVVPTLRTCFVVMGFHKKTDPATGRVLDLDKTYRHLIKPAAEAAGFRCFRADELQTAGVIDVPMYEWLYDADLVVADLSALNPNAFFELGVRYGLRPRTTVVIAEEKFVSPFDTNHIRTMPYRHDGEALDIDAVQAALPELTKAINAAIRHARADSPVYTYLPDLLPPALRQMERVAERQAAAEAAKRVEAAGTPEAREALDKPMAALIDLALKLREEHKFAEMAQVLRGVRIAQGDRTDDYVLQQLALAIYKSRKPSPTEALLEARTVLEELRPRTSLDAETVGLWAAVHKRLAEAPDRGDADRAADLDEAVNALHRGYLLLKDHYNGINAAFVYDLRASRSGGDDAVADAVAARRIRREVLAITERLLTQPPVGETEKARAEHRYWIAVTRAEALAGLGDFPGGRQAIGEAGQANGVEEWMRETARSQIDRLEELLS